MADGAHQLPFAAWVAWRYLRSTRRDAFISFLSLVTVGSIALGVGALILSLAALTGFQGALSREVLARTPAIRIDPAAGTDTQRMRDVVESLAGVTSVRWLVAGRGWLIANDRVRAVSITGFEGAVPTTFPGAAGGPPGLYIGRELAANWSLEPGADIEIASNQPTLTPLGPQPRVLRSRLVGTFESSNSVAEDRLALPMEEALRLLGSTPARLEVSTTDLQTGLDLATKLPDLLPQGTRVRSWRDLNRPLFFALRLEKGIMFVAVFLVVLVGALAMISDLNLIIATKRAEIGMLAAMGATSGDLRHAFVLLGAGLVALGGLAGAGCGLATAWILDRFRLVTLPSHVYFVDHVPFDARPVDVVAVLGLTALLALACAYGAAARAAALQPVEALRR